jgi:hypothetical protein
MARSLVVISSAVARLLRGQAFRRGVLIFLAVRIGLSLWAVLALAVVRPDTTPADPERPHFGIPPVEGGLAGLLLGPWQRFDTIHYLHLAQHGYEAGTPHTVFPPLFPLLIRSVGGLLGARYLLGALIVSNLCAIGYLTVLFALAESEVGTGGARRAQVYAAIYPWAFFLLAGYVESLFLLLAGLSLWMARRRRRLAAGAFGALAALARPQGVILALPLLFETLRGRKSRILPPQADLLWPLLPVMAYAGFQAGRALAGVEPIFTTYASHWHHVSALPWAGISTNLRNIAAGSAHPTDVLDLLAAGLAIGLAVVAWLRLDRSYALYMTAVLLVSVSHLRVPHPMASVGRYTVQLFPAFFILGTWGDRSPWLNRLILYPSIALLLYLSGQFVMWGWVG